MRDLGDGVKTYSTVLMGLHLGALFAQGIGVFLVSGYSDYGANFLAGTPLGPFFTDGPERPTSGFAGLAGLFITIWNFFVNFLGIFDFSYGWLEGHGGAAGWLLFLVRMIASFAASLFMVSAGQSFLSTGLFSHPLMIAAVFGITLSAAGIKQLLG